MAWELKVLVLVIGFVLIVCADNATAPGSPAALGSDAAKPPGAIASFIKMIMDLPMGLVEAFKDAADAIEALVVAFMRGLI